MRQMTNEKAIEAYNAGADILYRVWIVNKSKMSGWRSYRKANSGSACIPWPWDMPHGIVEWKIKER
jgi:hypothetical protein